MKALLAAAGLLCAVATAAADDLEILVPDGKDLFRIRLELTDGGAPPDRAWTKFLDRLFDYFDRDGDGALSPAEAARIFPLPLPGGRQVVVDFPALDSNRDGEGSRAEFRAFYRGRGFTPVVTLNRVAPRESFALAAALFHHLDSDGDGKLSAAELRRAPALLRRLDEDEDEVLTATELLTFQEPQALPGPSGMRIASIDKSAAADAVLRWPVDGGRPLLVGKGAFRLAADGGSCRFPGGSCRLEAATGDSLAAFRAARKFYLAQFRALSTDDSAARKIFDDPSAGVLAGLFDVADRNGDGKLTVAELATFFDLVELGVQCQVVVAATDRGRNLFDLFDTDQDGRLDLAELLHAARALPDALARERPLEQETVPASYRLSIARGPVSTTFGPVPFGAAAKPKPSGNGVRTRGPRWFQAMDRNGDGFVSRQEFLGSPELFAKLDTNGDGRISLEEAENADASARP